MKSNQFIEIIEGFTEWMTRLNYSTKSVLERTRQLEVFFDWIGTQRIINPTDIEQTDLKNYNKWLHEKPIKSKTIMGYIGALKLCNKYLENHGQPPILTTKLTIGKDLEYKRNMLSRDQIDKLNAACGNDLYGMRDSAMLAVFYGCGLRCSEGANLQLSDVDFKRALLQVKKGKNYRERYVPMSVGVKNELMEWLPNGQHYFAKKNNYVIPSRTGKRMGCHGLTRRVKLLCEKAGIKKPISLHGLRHSIATHLLQSGLALEQISQFLGHSSLETTQIYTRMSHEF